MESQLIKLTVGWIEVWRVCLPFVLYNEAGVQPVHSHVWSVIEMLSCRCTEPSGIKSDGWMDDTFTFVMTAVPF